MDPTATPKDAFSSTASLRSFIGPMKTIQATPIRVHRLTYPVSGMYVYDFDNTKGRRLKAARRMAGLDLCLAATLLDLMPSELAMLEHGSRTFASDKLWEESIAKFQSRVDHEAYLGGWTLSTPRNYQNNSQRSQSHES